MSEIKLDMEAVEAAVLGGTILGGGGGGSMIKGRELGELAVRIGEPRLVDVEDLPDDALIVTVSAVGAPAAKEGVAKPFAYLRAVVILKQNGGDAQGFISSECGGIAVVNGWLQSAVFGIPVVDAPSNGRAQPIIPMGSMGLHAIPGFVSLQAAAGGNTTTGRYTEVCVRGSLMQASAAIRQFSAQAGGLVAVARNPVQAGYIKKNGAPGAVKQAIELGRAMLNVKHKGAEAIINAVTDTLGGRIVDESVVESVELKTSGGFDTGKVIFSDYELTFWNEYMTLDKGNNRVSTFPNLIMTIDAESGTPVTSAEIKEGQKVALLVVPKERLLLGGGMRYKELFELAEDVVGKPMVQYLDFD